MTDALAGSGEKKLNIRKIKGILSYVYTFVVVPFIIALMYLIPTQQRRFRRWCGTWFMTLFRIKVRLEGEFDTSAQVIVLNHQSYLDVIFLEAFYPGALCWVAKKELGDLFFYGHALKAPKMILLDREDKRSLVMLFKLAKERLDENRILAIFPEGTRSAGKEEFLPFKSGAKLLIEKHHLRYQPIVVVHTRRFFDIGKPLVGGGESLFVTLPARDFVPKEKRAESSADSQDAQQAESPDWFTALRDEMHACYMQHYQPQEIKEQ